MITPPHIDQRIREAAKGDAQSMAFLFQLYRPQLYALALKFVGNPLAQDVVQDTFISAFTHISSLRDVTVLLPWLKRILVNHCYQILRKDKSARQYRNTIPKDTFLEAAIDGQLEAVADTQQLFTALNELSPELRSCVLLRYFSHFDTYSEIATILDIPIGTVRSRLAAAREKLYAVFSHYHDASDRILRESQEWTSYYLQIWTRFYEDPAIRIEFFNHLDPVLRLRYTSGRTGRGREHLEREVDDDLEMGSRYIVKEVNTCGNVSVLEGINVNTTEFPNRCAPSSVIVLFRDNRQIVDTCHIFDSPRVI